MRNWIGSFIHNCIAHPLLCFLPRKYGVAFHDWTIEKFWPPKNKITWDPKTDIISLDGKPIGREE